VYFNLNNDICLPITTIAIAICSTVTLLLQIVLDVHPSDTFEELPRPFLQEHSSNLIIVCSKAAFLVAEGFTIAKCQTTIAPNRIEAITIYLTQ
jgi:hypothetical protein